ncbi:MULTISPECIES: hypothetical protein [Haloferax]|uniref:hypothetical protein n=1 Tax=Haloferax TaxID=2251 RepID=UPI00178099E9|nr:MULTISPECIES: hypothetical protein [Haloferax]
MVPLQIPGGPELLIIALILLLLLLPVVALAGVGYVFFVRQKDESEDDGSHSDA